MHWKDRVALTIYKYKAELGMAALSISFGLWLYNNSGRIILVDFFLVNVLSIALLVIGVARSIGILFRSYTLRKWAANIAIALWMSFFTVSLYIRSEFSIILLSLLIGSLVVRASQKIERRANGRS